MSSPVYPESNAYIKHYVRTLKNALTKSKAAHIPLPRGLLYLEWTHNGPAKCHWNLHSWPVGTHLQQKEPFLINYKTIRDDLRDWLVAQKSVHEKHRKARELPLLHKYQELLNQAANCKWLPAMATQVELETFNYLVTNDSVTAFRRKQRMLKPVDYTDNPEQSNKAAI